MNSHDPQDESLPLTSEQLDEMASNAVKGFDSTLSQVFHDAVLECIGDINKFMELMENEKDQGKICKAAKRLEAALLEQTKAYIEAEYN